MAAIELVEDKKTRKPYPLKARFGHRVCGIARQRGLLLRPLGNIIVLIPPLSTTLKELRHMIEIVRYAIVKAHDQL
jgi:adenosylmethionine-8-amino-7-oxononanoate aminotransferase